MTTSKLALDGFLPSGGLDSSSASNPNGNALHANGNSNGHYAGSHDHHSHQQQQHHHHANVHRQYNHSTLPPNRGRNNPSILSPLSPLFSAKANQNGFPPSVLPPYNNDAASPFAPAGAYPPQPTNNYTYQSPPHHTDAVPRSSHLSPTKNGRRYSPPILPPEVNGAASLYRSVSADPTSASHAPSQNHLVQRLAQQNALIREAWEAERNYLEANRRRAEEVYQEERVIMEEVREGWDNEKAIMLHEIQALKERIQRLEGENHTLKAVASQSVQISGVMSPQASQRGDSIDTSTNASAASASSGFNGHLPLHGLQHPLPSEIDPHSLPPGLDGASRRPHFAKIGSSRTSPTGQPESSPFIPLDPRMQPQTSTAKDFLSPSTDESDTPVPVIDVQEVDPKLDGISLKATAVQKFTFASNDSNVGTPLNSPPAGTEHVPDHSRPAPPAKRPSSKENTIQVMQAAEHRRLTMHAGHTPNHSLSLFPTMSLAASSTGPTQDDDTPEQTLDSAPDPQYEPESDSEPEHTDHREIDDGFIDGIPKEIMEPEDDVKLKGPLMIKNIPAQDEIFWDQVNRKLEPISQGQDSLPTVMRSSIGEEDALGAPQGLRAPVAPVGGDASHDAGGTAEEDAAAVSAQKGVDGDIPLKLRTTTNFGAPFGMA